MVGQVSAWAAPTMSSSEVFLFSGHSIIELGKERPALSPWNFFFLVGGGAVGCGLDYIVFNPVKQSCLVFG